jgi:peptide chain release factor subunit 1
VALSRQALNELLEDDAKFGFIVMDGNGTLFGTLSGNTRTVLHKITVDLPKKHGRGGQSALRFARLRLEKRHNYLRRVAELSVQLFISDNKVLSKFSLVFSLAALD